MIKIKYLCVDTHGKCKYFKPDGFCEKVCLFYFDGACRNVDAQKEAIKEVK